MSILTNQVGINIAQNAIQLVEITQKQNNFFLENVDEEFFEETLDCSLKETKFIHILQNAFNEIILRKPLKTANIFISLPLSYFKIFEIPVDKNLTKNDLNDYIIWEFSQLFPTENKLNYFFDNIFFESLDYLPFKRCLVFSLNKDLLKRLFKFSMRNNLQLRIVDFSHAASNSILFSNQDKFNGLSLHIEDKKISIMVFDHSKLILVKVKNYFNISEVPALVVEVIEELEKRNLLKEKLTNLHLSGSTISNELSNNIKESVNLIPIFIDPLKVFNLDGPLLESKLQNGSLTKYIAALGMALRQVS